ncbi:MAG TPA: biotin/lipoyl-binding protein [candidate division Zixibacteria bacterium]|nr:biotin/lipoyl-binding protein [candidate division Zixibacteria bacterium]
MGEYILRIADKDYKVKVAKIEGNLASVVIDGVEIEVVISQFGKKEDAEIRPRRKKKAVQVVEQAPAVTAPVAPASKSNNEQVRAPIPGVILKLLVKEGDVVKAGQDIIVMEAMKMENQIQATLSGRIAKINVRVDDSVQQDDVLLEIERS